ncbi:MAG: hypothetical protein BTN85_1070 [Candidatus Methanohalarchaeum thermophilum]|uniref:Uncharacterized protein n=1 Tax=Methanohalarchaeum thermophilum TaxID=1903181 RepID=A0A1Q6DW45_METT1|nr:MAG: hypothetical protein BTN85_1070 [Candidatus Methanohalarchaeum thermophilum]
MISVSQQKCISKYLGFRIVDSPDKAKEIKKFKNMGKIVSLEKINSKFLA